MSTYYDFMVEAKYKDKWYNIDLHTKDFDGKLRHQYLATFSRSFVGQLESLIDGAWRIGFDDLAESTQNLLLSSIPAECEDSVRLEQFYVAREVLEMAEQIAAQLDTRVFQSKIRGSVSVAESPAHGVSVLDYAPRSKPSLDFEALCEEIAGGFIPHGGRRTDGEVR